MTERNDRHRIGLGGLKGIALEKFRLFFFSIGGFIYDHPFWFICGSSLFALLSGLSFMSIVFEGDADRLYALPASKARADLAKQASLFGTPPRISMVFVVSRHDNGTNVLTKPILDKLSKMDQFIHHKLKSKQGWTFEDVCYRQIMQYNTTVEDQAPSCVKMTPLDLYRTEKLYGLPIVTRNWPYVPNLSQNRIVKADLALADPVVQHLPSGTTKLFKASGFLLLYHASGSKEQLQETYEWEQALIDFINHDIKPFSFNGELDISQQSDYPFFFSDYPDHDWREFKVFVNAERSWEDELSRSTMFDARLIRDYVIAYILIAIYMVVFNRTSNPIRSKSVCGFLGSVSALLGYAAGGGICYWLGMKHCPTMHASPFLVLAIGLDNTFVVLNFYTLSYGQAKSPRERCRNALTDSGLALFITTFTSVLSFAVGALGPYTAVRNFCIQTGMGLSGGFIYNIIFFYPFLCLEAKAEARNSIFFVPDAVAQKWLKRITQINEIEPQDHTLLKNAVFPGDPFQRAIPDDQTDCEVRNAPGLADISPQSSESWVYSVDSRDPTISRPVYRLEIDELHKSIEFNIPETEDSLRERFVKNRSMFEVASLQWAFISRRQKVLAESKRRNIDLNGETLDDARSVLPLNAPGDGDQWMHMNPEDMLNCDLKTVHKASELGLKLLEEPQGNKGKTMRRFLMEHIGPWLTNRRLQFVALSAMLIYLVVFTFMAVANLRAGLELENLTPPDSYLREAFTVSHDKFPIFPKQTFVMFTRPKDGAGSDPGLLSVFNDEGYGAREPDSTLQILMNSLTTSEEPNIQDYYNALGEIAWWDETTFRSLIDLDAKLRSMPEIQDVLNGMLLFYQEHGAKFLKQRPDQTEENRREIFYSTLNNWLRHGVVGVHVRDQFKFDHSNSLPPVRLRDGQEIPQLLSFRLMIFNYNFLNSHAQSRYMLRIRDLVNQCSEAAWIPAFNKLHTFPINSDDLNTPVLEGQKMVDAPYPPYHDILRNALNSTGQPAAWQTSGHSNFKAQAFMDTFLFFETDATIWPSTLLNMLTAFVSILLATSVLMEGWANVALVTLIICAVDIGVFGGMAMCGIQLNILSMILLVLSIGFSVDYTVHVIHTFCHTVGKDANARAVETMILICSPMTHGALSTLLGLLPIYFREEYVMQNFSWMMALVIIFGFINGVIFLPIVMSRSREWLQYHPSDGNVIKEVTSQLVGAICHTDDNQSASLDLKPEVEAPLRSCEHSTAETLFT